MYEFQLSTQNVKCRTSNIRDSHKAKNNPRTPSQYKNDR